MKKIVLLTGLLVAILAGVGTVLYYSTKSKSPETSVVHDAGDLKITVFYNRPYKKGRLIFGGLVPYGKTWRTGANEATTFETNKALQIGDKVLPAGKYSLWTVPGEQTWQVVFNSTIPSWGIDVMNNSEAARKPETDVVIVEVPVAETDKVFEQFTISIDDDDDMLQLVLAWDQVVVAVPFSASAK